MRTTLTLDDDVAAALGRLRRDRDLSLKEIVNEALRRGLSDLENPREPTTPYATEGRSLGGCRLPALDDIAEALAFGEGEEFR